MTRDRPRRLPHVMAIAVALWIAVFGFMIIWTTRHANSDLQFTNPAVGRIAFWLYFLAFPCAVIALAVWYEWPVLNGAARAGRILIVIILCIVFLGSAAIEIAFTPNTVEIQRLKMDGYDIVLEIFRPALSIGSIDIGARQEWSFLPGVVRSRFARRWSHRNEGTLRIQSSSPSVDSVAVHLPATSRSSAVDTMLVLSSR